MFGSIPKKESRTHNGTKQFDCNFQFEFELLVVLTQHIMSFPISAGIALTNSVNAFCTNIPTTSTSNGNGSYTYTYDPKPSSVGCPATSFQLDTTTRADGSVGGGGIKSGEYNMFFAQDDFFISADGY